MSIILYPLPSSTPTTRYAIDACRRAHACKRHGVAWPLGAASCAVPSLAHATQALTKQIKRSVEAGGRLHDELSLIVKDFVRNEDSLTYAILPKVCVLAGVCVFLGMRCLDAQALHLEAACRG